MRFASEYHDRVWRFRLISVALSGAVLFVLVSTGTAQTNGVPFSGTSVGSVRPMAGPVVPHTGSVIAPTGSVRPPTGTVGSVNASRNAPNSQVTFSGSSRSHDGDRRPHRHSRGDYAVPFLYGVPVPYGVDSGYADNSADADDEADYQDDQGGPTVFDRRGSGANSYVPPVDSADDSVEHANVAPAVPDPPLPPTVLVFKDGHTVELGNYAIVGVNLFDLTPGHTRKVPLADIDLAATQRQNDDRGVTFALPTSPQAN